MPLPQTPVSGMYNKHGGKTRLTFKLDQDELWIGTKGEDSVNKVAELFVTFKLLPSDLGILIILIDHNQITFSYPFSQNFICIAFI